MENQLQKKIKLPEQQDKWVKSITLSPYTTVKYIGKTQELLVTQSTKVTELNSLKTIEVGDEISGIHIGAIRCIFFSEDAGKGVNQYMWQGQWGCMAGRTEQELATAIRADGVKVFDYIYASPVNLD
ncbi:hypothetical protein [Polynucleobacter necessarius]|uniref:hypothetical protein n=1 Tax=Polynucleobacter necessarius TaxID=576610 RepID=UPI000E09395E|nr:hypothetical protein [Polynucleobacter necessarius]